MSTLWNRRAWRAAFRALLLLASASAAQAEPTLQQRIAAARSTASGNAYCTAAFPYYWEVGDSAHALVSGTEGGEAPTAHTSMLIASATKWLFGAYVVERREGELRQADIAALTMTSGYHDLAYQACLRLRERAQARETVAQCFHTWNNDGYSASDEGSFYYNGGHFQKLAAEDLGLGALNNRALARELHRELGYDFQFSFNSPQLAGGARSSAADYAVFLRKILKGQLRIGDLLGSHAVCTDPYTCPTAISTPAPAGESWDYSLGHWVESDPLVGDGSYSSAGALGFYPWIDQSRQWYGVIAREAGIGASGDSLNCGRLIRQAWISGEAP